MKYFQLILLVALAAFACQAPKTEVAETTAAPVLPVTLKMKWQTDTVLTTCESVIYDKEKDVLYVANINGQPDGKDGNGFISKVTLDGKVSELQWVKGIDAPKGMGLYNGKLFVADIDRIHEIETASGKIVKTYAVEGATFLNDITVDANGKVYISDTGSGDISVIDNGKLSKYLSGTTAPNGLLSEANRMLMLSFGASTLSTIDSANQITVQADSIENADGIEAIGDGAYLISSWNGIIHHVGADWKRTVLLDTRADSVNSADIEYIQEKNLLLVPTFFKNTVVAYEVTK